MSTRLLLFALLLAGECETDTGDPTDDSAIEEDACPDGLVTPTTAGLTITSLTINGLSSMANFDPDATYEGQSAMCVAEDGSRIEGFFQVGGTPFGRIIAEVTQYGNLDANGDTDNLTISLFGNTPPVAFQNGDWQTYTWTVDETENTMAFDFYGFAVQDGGNTMEIRFSIEATP